MTTAHRPTWAAAVGGSEQGGNRNIAPTRQYSSRDLPGHLKVKTRQPGQGTKDEYRNRDFRRELEEKERKAKKLGTSADDEKETLRLKDSKADPANIDADDDVDEEVKSNSSDSDSDSSSEGSKKESERSGSDSDDSDDDDDDDDEELMRELEKIKRERAEEQERKRFEEEQELARKSAESMLRGNPLLNPGGESSYAIKRRWDDDVVFKNQSRKEDPEKKKRFINDTTRNDFHRSFLKKYIR
eukprot:TRINITY_DN2539_c0_g1_i1.p1 TRINITY_DN2539_c0_g1~~TRINITY_DN2539_c0_g1_i1.p1  ORF type:complete len:243 (+),score=79.75 TRINITY_DN2539_c0_g1_i1:51-779(+)